MTTPTEQLLSTRGKTHGNYADHARITQNLKILLENELINRAARLQPRLSHGQQEALDMIVHKIGRIIAGDANYADHWDDIAGYALLGRDCPYKESVGEVAGNA